MRRLSQGVFEFSRSHNQEGVEQHINTGILSPESMFLVAQLLPLMSGCHGRHSPPNKDHYDTLMATKHPMNPYTIVPGNVYIRKPSTHNIEQPFFSF